jgi:hypothetical protein
LFGIDHAANRWDEPLRQVALPLQRGQIRSPTHALSNVPLQLRQIRAFRCVSSGPVLSSFFMPLHVGLQSPS